MQAMLQAGSIGCYCWHIFVALRIIYRTGSKLYSFLCSALKVRKIFPD
jgi:hypothetical protein